MGASVYDMKRGRGEEEGHTCRYSIGVKRSSMMGGDCEGEEEVVVVFWFFLLLRFGLITGTNRTQHHKM